MKSKKIVNDPKQVVAELLEEIRVQQAKVVPATSQLLEVQPAGSNR